MGDRLLTRANSPAELWGLGVSYACIFYITIYHLIGVISAEIC
jgi:hypothetical protein